MFHAHSTSLADRSAWQTLPEHSRAVAALAAGFGERIGIAGAAGLAGLLHDLGKYDPDFQKRLAGANIAVEHSIA
ncbi:CRISPR-associated endonuclease Cas3'', partial [Mycobacterium tuberculosis]|nr:CRISPR-associated endonuclease Cas3'' [Mycobacterium tuberculosis]